MPDHILQRLADAVLRLDQQAVERLTVEALATQSPYAVIADGLSRGMQQIGEQFKAGEVFIPEVMVACDCYYAGLKLARPRLREQDCSFFLGKMILGTIHGDIHTVGKDVALPVFEAAGFDVIDLGVAVPDARFVEAIREHQPQIVGLGTYMTPTFMHTRETVRVITEAGLRDGVKIICGGPSVSAEAARRMGADDASDNAWEAVEIMKRWVAPRQPAA
jgi:5-methyltetrahydrofolate--homocysteine methyltransferase